VLLSLFACGLLFFAWMIDRLSAEKQHLSHNLEDLDEEVRRAEERQVWRAQEAARNAELLRVARADVDRIDKMYQAVDGHLAEIRLALLAPQGCNVAEWAQMFTPYVRAISEKAGKEDLYRQATGRPL
jgi:hypothetical protein